MRSRNGVGGGVGGDDDELLSVCPSVYRSNRSFLGPAGYIILQSQSQSSVRPAVPTPFPALLNTNAEILCGDFIATGKYRDSAEKDLDESQIQILLQNVINGENKSLVPPLSHPDLGSFMHHTTRRKLNGRTRPPGGCTPLRRPGATVSLSHGHA